MALSAGTLHVAAADENLDVVKHTVLTRLGEIGSAVDEVAVSVAAKTEDTLAVRFSSKHAGLVAEAMRLVELYLASWGMHVVAVIFGEAQGSAERPRPPTGLNRLIAAHPVASGAKLTAITKVLAVLHEAERSLDVKAMIELSGVADTQIRPVLKVLCEEGYVEARGTRKKFYKLSTFGRALYTSDGAT